MKKRLNEEGIINELTGKSAFFPAHGTTPAASPPHEEKKTRSDDTPVSHDTEDTDVAGDTSVSSETRRIKRHLFDIYVDQHARMKYLQAHSVLEGNPKTMGDLIREALDEYLAKHHA